MIDVITIVTGVVMIIGAIGLFIKESHLKKCKISNCMESNCFSTPDSSESTNSRRISPSTPCEKTNLILKK